MDRRMCMNQARRRRKAQEGDNVFKLYANGHERTERRERDKKAENEFKRVVEWDTYGARAREGGEFEETERGQRKCSPFFFLFRRHSWHPHWLWAECKLVGAPVVDVFSFWCRWFDLYRERGHWGFDYGDETDPFLPRGKASSKEQSVCMRIGRQTYVCLRKTRGEPHFTCLLHEQKIA